MLSLLLYITVSLPKETKGKDQPFFQWSVHHVSQEIYQNCCDHPVKAKTKFHVLFYVS